ncbi:hypothetical protein D049_2732 [Vibrio parahaemolyticus VPTS-2010]|nr:hypothetical protein D041_2536 [Vibrio parahaemolyticus EKP-008]EXJ43435.1 hypothetical protein D049_2732 [Vibrio parahaemolyticus VPTS-2010]
MALFVLWLTANHANDTVTLDYFTVTADFFNGSTNFHC